MDMEKVKLYARLTAARQKLAQADEALKKRLQPLEEELKEAYAEEGVDSLRVETGLGIYKNVGLSAQLWANKRDDDPEGQLAHAAIRKAGWGFMIQERFNTQTLSSEVRTMIKDKSDETGHPLTWEEALPDYLKDNLKISEVFKLKVTAASVKAKKPKGSGKKKAGGKVDAATMAELYEGGE